jgi:hypothetical protein
MEMAGNSTDSGFLDGKENPGKIKAPGFVKFESGLPSAVLKPDLWAGCRPH